MRVYLSKFKSVLTVVVFLSLLFIFFGSILNKDIFSEKYGFSAGALSMIFISAEIFFNVGIFLMLKGSGLLKVGWKDIIRFRFGKLSTNTKTFYFGFIINRAAAAVPWIYVLSVGWSKLPVTILGLVLLEIVVVVILTLGVIEFSKIYDHKKS